MVFFTAPFFGSYRLKITGVAFPPLVEELKSLCSFWSFRFPLCLRPGSTRPTRSLGVVRLACLHTRDDDPHHHHRQPLSLAYLPKGLQVKRSTLALPVFDRSRPAFDKITRTTQKAKLAWLSQIHIAFYPHFILVLSFFSPVRICFSNKRAAKCHIGKIKVDSYK